jgi:two-component system, chemotaxis family, protein-glutamate methylesterase/glutaminase
MGKRRVVPTRTGSVVALGASAGGLDALSRVIGDLPPDLGAPVLVVLHTAPTTRTYLAKILGRAGPLPARLAVDGDELEPNHVYVAPPDHHLIVLDGKMHVVRGPHENGHRPAIDPLFRSAALSYREGTIAVVLSGVLDDGAAGSTAVSQLGGSVIVQDPAEAEFPDMPRNAIVADSPHAVLPLAKIAGAIVALVHAPPDPEKEREVEEELRLERDYAALDDQAISREDVFPDLAPYACPSCGGTLWEAPDPHQLRFRCRIGHAFGSETLLSEQSQSLDASLAAALRALHERADLARRVGRRLRAAGADARAERYDRIVKESERDALAIRKVLLSRDGADS